MRATTPTAHSLRGIVRRVRDWPVASQQQARRNAMIAATACAQRRAERDEVADYLAALDSSRTPAGAGHVTGAEASRALPG